MSLSTIINQCMEELCDFSLTMEKEIFSFYFDPSSTRALISSYYSHGLSSHIWTILLLAFYGNERYEVSNFSNKLLRIRPI